MSQENMELLRRWYEMANRRDDAGRELLDPEFEFRPAGLFPDLPKTGGDRDEFVAFLWKFVEPWEALTIEPDRYLDIGSQVLVLAHFHAKGRNGIEVERPFAHLWTIRDGRAVRLVAYADHEQALEAVGLTEQDARAEF